MNGLLITDLESLGFEETLTMTLTFKEGGKVDIQGSLGDQSETETNDYTLAGNTVTIISEDVELVGTVEGTTITLTGLVINDSTPEVSLIFTKQ